MKSFRKTVLFSIITGLTMAMIISVLSRSSQVVAQMGGHDMSGMSSMEGMMGGSAGSTHMMPGMVHQMCSTQGDMPPHYCEPMYHTMSSVKGIRISTVQPISDNEVLVSLKEINSKSNGVSQKIVVAGGSGDLAGAIMVDGGWKGITHVNLKLNGLGTIYDHGSMHIHIFPYTG
jgi:hypothetical protein